MNERVYSGEVHYYCSNCLGIINDCTNGVRCMVCGDLYCADCIRKNEISEYVCARCVEEE